MTPDKVLERRLARAVRRVEILETLMEDRTRELYLANRELATSEALFRNLFESSRDALLTLEPPDWEFHSANPAARMLFGADSMDEFKSFHPWDLSPERQPDGRLSAEKGMDILAIAMRDGFCFFEWLHRRITGEEFPADVLLTRVELAGRTFLQTTVRDISETKRAELELLQANELLTERADRDALTGLWNRGAIMEALEREIARSDREGHPVAVLLADIDFFKRVNDTLGHQAGDSVLRETARRMLMVQRPYDTIGRFGGEEFLILAPGCGLDAGRTVAERTRAALADHETDTTEGGIQVTISLGVTSYAPRSGATSADLLRVADQALYLAKRNGRNRVETGYCQV